MRKLLESGGTAGLSSLQVSKHKCAFPPFLLSFFHFCLYFPLKGFSKGEEVRKKAMKPRYSDIDNPFYREQSKGGTQDCFRALSFILARSEQRSSMLRCHCWILTWRRSRRSGRNPRAEPETRHTALGCECLRSARAVRLQPCSSGCSALVQHDTRLSFTTNTSAGFCETTRVLTVKHRASAL